jgi:hypothetical protein
MARFALQCVAAAFVSLAIPLANSLWIRSSLSGPPLVNADGSIDDAPERAAMVFLILSPLFLAFLSVYFAGSTALLRRLGHLSLVPLYLFDLLVALAAATYFARDRYGDFGARDAALSLAVFGVLGFLSLALGSTAWWLLRPAAAQRPVS